MPIKKLTVAQWRALQRGEFHAYGYDPYNSETHNEWWHARFVNGVQ